MTWLKSTRLMLLALPLLSTMQACAYLTPTPDHDPVMVSCKSFAIIHDDPKTDSLETLRQVKQHNAAYHALCDGWGGVVWGVPK